MSRSNAIPTLTSDGRLLFLTRFFRLFSYGALSVVLVFYLTGLGLGEAQTGLLLTLTLLGDTAVSLYLTTQADRLSHNKSLHWAGLAGRCGGLKEPYTLGAKRPRAI